MTKLTFKDIEERGLLLYKYIRGSQAYGTNTPESDQDEGGIFIAPQEWLDGLGLDYMEEVSDDKHDTVWWELGKFLKLLCTSNPTVLEALFIPEDKILYEHPIMTKIKKYRDMFVTKASFKPFGGYATSQISKAQGLNKKIHWDIQQMTRKTPLDFCYTFRNQGSQNIIEWLKERGLDQRNCGLVNIPNMKDTYGVYYDYGQHFLLNNIDRDYLINTNPDEDPFITYIFNEFVNEEAYDMSYYAIDMYNLYDELKTPKGGHCGIVSESGESNGIRFSSVEKDDKPICYMTYNQNGYESHCKKYREYMEWKEKRNKARYENNLEGLEKDKEKFYDSKNMMHCFRLLTMCIEVAEGKGIIVDRTHIDRDFLMDVRNRKYTYKELMEKLLELKERMDKAIENSQIRENIDVEFVNVLLLECRKYFRFLKDEELSNGFLFLF
jgi:predicted nucleotidyltransferase